MYKTYALILSALVVLGLGSGGEVAHAADGDDVVSLSACTNQLLADGSRGPCIKSLQHSLAALGVKPLKEDAVYAARTRLAVFYFQGWEGLPQDGIAGPTTISALDRAANAPPPPGRPELPALPDKDAEFFPDGIGLLKCGAASCTNYFGREATKRLNADLNDPENQLGQGATGAAYCKGISKASKAGGGVCGAAAMLGTYAVQRRVQDAVNANSCFTLKTRNLGPFLGENVPELGTNNGHNCIP